MKRLRIIAVILGLALVGAACGNSPDDTGGENGGNGGGDGLSGTIDIDGSSTVGPLTDAIAEEYASEQPDVTVNLSISGTGGGFERFCGSGDTHISNASRPIKDEEAELCEENGIEFIEVRVGTDALTMVTHPDTDFLDCLTTEEIRSFWAADPAVSNWSEVNSEFPDEEIAIFAPGVDSGTYDFFNETVLEEDTETRQDYNASEDDNIIAEGVIGTPNSWGYFGFAYFQENSDRMKAIGYDAGEGCVAPSVETAQDDSYKLARPLFIYLKQSALTSEHVADFATFYLENVNSLIEDVGYIPAPDATITESQEKVADAIAAA